jgi:hypothetical protein
MDKHPPLSCRGSRFGVSYDCDVRTARLAVMKLIFFLPSLMLGTFVMSVCQAEVLTFEDLHPPIGVNISTFPDNPYHGLYWNNDWSVVNAIGYANSNGTNGFFYGMVSLSNVASRPFPGPQEVYSPTTNFNFFSVYLTGAWNSNLNVEVQGFSGTNLLYDQTVIASATNSTLFTFNYLNVDRVVFNSFGGDVAFTTAGGTRFAMDNFSFEFVPEPSAFLLTVAGALLLSPLLKRRR